MAVKNDEKTKMKGKNRPSRSYRKKKTNIIDEKKVNCNTKMAFLFPGCIIHTDSKVMSDSTMQILTGMRF